MYIIVGKITEDRREMAYKVFDYDTCITRIVTKQELKDKLMQGERIIGFDLSTNQIGNVGLRKNNSFLWKNIVELEGNGEVQSEKDNKTEILIGTVGYRDYKNYVFVNPSGKISVYAERVLRTMLPDDRLIGVKISEDKKLSCYKKIDLTEGFLKNLGYKKEEFTGDWLKDNEKE